MQIRRSGIYFIQNIINGRCYVGSTNDKVQRWAYHRWRLRSDTHPNQHLQRAWNKYGEEKFEFIWVSDVPEGQLLAEEQRWLDSNQDGYNIATDARAFAKGRKWSEERKRAASIACTGRRHSAETRKKIGDVQRGKPKGKRSAEHCRRLSEAMKGKRNGLGSTRSPEAREKCRLVNLGNKHFLGKHHTEESKRKMSEVKKGMKMSDEQRRQISEVQIGRVHSAETRAKRSASLKAFYRKKREQQA